MLRMLMKPRWGLTGTQTTQSSLVLSDTLLYILAVSVLSVPTQPEVKEAFAGSVIHVY